MSWGHVKPTQRGKPKTTKRQAQHGVEGGAPHRAEAFAAIQYEDAGKKATHHLQTSEQKTGDQADRPDARTVAEATRYPNGDNRGKPSEPLISPREGGPERRAAAGKHQTAQKPPGQTPRPDTETNQPKKGEKSKPACQRGNQPHQRHNNDRPKTRYSKNECRMGGARRHPPACNSKLKQKSQVHQNHASQGGIRLHSEVKQGSKRGRGEQLQRLQVTAKPTAGRPSLMSSSPSLTISITVKSTPWRPTPNMQDTTVRRAELAMNVGRNTQF